MKFYKYLAMVMIITSLTLAFIGCSQSPQAPEISASSTFQEYHPGNAINNEGKKYWHSQKGTPQWWQIKYNAEKTVTKLGLQPPCYNGCMIKDFILQGSNDGKDWKNLFSGQHSNTPQMEYYDISGSPKFTYYRVYINNVWRQDDFAGIQDIVLK